jgi:hypothetical protein
MLYKFVITLDLVLSRPFIKIIPVGELYSKIIRGIENGKVVGRGDGGGQFGKTEILKFVP